MADGFDKVKTPVDITFHGMDAGFAIVHRAHGHPFSHELLAKFDIVDHIAVVRADQIAVRVKMRLGIDLRRLAKGSPAQLGDAT